MTQATNNAPLRFYGLSREMLQTADAITHGANLTDHPEAGVDRDVIVLRFGMGFGSAEIVIRRKLSGFSCLIDVSVLLPDGQQERTTYNAEVSVDLIAFWSDLTAEIHRRANVNAEERSRMVAEFLKGVSS